MGKKFTSIFHYEKSNYQVDFQNPEAVSKFNDYCEDNDVIWGLLFGEEAVSKFNDYCEDNDVIWGLLFGEESDQPVAKYYKGLGFI